MSKSKNNSRKTLSILRNILTIIKKSIKLSNILKKLGFHPHSIFAKSLYSSLTEKHQNKLQDYTTHYTLTYLNLITTIGRETNDHKNRP